MRYHIKTRLSEHIEQTPEGYLLCRAVPIARTGGLDYTAEELPADVAGGQKAVRVFREAADLFAPPAVASFEGKPLTIDHPEDFVHPDNWREEAVGHVQNVQRGTGANDDLLLADILIMDEEAITLVQNGLRELSCGYDADYVAMRPGVGRQVNIAGNHVALVHKGRCGPRCAIKDKAHEESMSKSFFDRILGSPGVRRAMRDAEAEALKTGDEAPEQPKGEDPAPATDSETGGPAGDSADLGAKLDEAILLLRSLVEALHGTKTGDNTDGNTADSGTGGTEDEDSQTADEDTADNDGSPCGATKTADSDTLRTAQILAPALRFRAGDSAALVQRAALRSAMGEAAVARTVNACLGRHTVDSAPQNLLNAAFVAAGAVQGNANSRRTADALTRAKAKDGTGNTPTPASINALNRDFYKK